MKTSLKSLALLCSISAFGVLTASADVFISDPNLLSGNVPQTTSAYGPSYHQSYITDGADTTFVFTEAATEPNPRMIFTGLLSSIDTIRIFDGGGNRASSSVTIFYGNQLNDPSTNPFGLPTGLTLLNTYNLAVSAGSDHYTDFTSADGFSYAQLTGLGIPDGTRTLYLEFSAAQGQYGPSFREVQAFAAVPEPTTWALALVAGSVLLIARKARRIAR